MKKIQKEILQIYDISNKMADVYAEVHQISGKTSTGLCINLSMIDESTNFDDVVVYFCFLLKQQVFIETGREAVVRKRILKGLQGHQLVIVIKIVLISLQNNLSEQFLLISGNHRSSTVMQHSLSPDKRRR